ncbi:hypothetical protein [Micromonospora chokoriensis]
MSRAFNPADDLPESPDEADYDSVDEFNAAEDEYWEQHDAFTRWYRRWLNESEATVHP